MCLPPKYETKKSMTQVFYFPRHPRTIGKVDLHVIYSTIVDVIDCFSNTHVEVCNTWCLVTHGDIPLLEKRKTKAARRGLEPPFHCLTGSFLTFRRPRNTHIHYIFVYAFSSDDSSRTQDRIYLLPFSMYQEHTFYHYEKAQRISYLALCDRNQT